MRSRSWRVLIATSVVVSSFLAVSLTSASPDNLPGGGWYTGEQIQNISTDGSEATISITAYQSDGTPFASDIRDSVPQYASETFLPSDFANMPDGFQGAAVVSSDKDIVAIVNIVNNLCCGGAFGSPDGAAQAQYQGTSADSADTVLNFPLVLNDHVGQTTTFFVQNASPDQNAQLTFTFDFPSPWGDTCHPYSPPAIGPSTMVVVTAVDAGCGSGTGAVGSLRVTQGANPQPLAGVSAESDTSSTTAAKQMSATRGLTPAMKSSQLYAPIIKKYWSRPVTGHFTGLQIQNAGDVTIPAGDIEVTYSIVACYPGPCPYTSSTDTNTSDLAPGESWNLTHNQSYPDNKLPMNSLASATVRSLSGKQLVAVVNEKTEKGYTPATKTTYYGIPSVMVTPKASMPTYKENWRNRYTGVQVFAIGNGQPGATAVIRATISTNEGRRVVVQTNRAVSSFTLLRLSDRPQPDLIWVQGTPADLAGANNGGTVSGMIVEGLDGSGNATVNVAAIANETTYNSSTVLDDNNYEGFSLP